MTAIDDGSVAFFCVVDGIGYLPKAITALGSIRRFHAAAGYFVAGRFGDDRDAMRLLERHRIGFEHLDLSDVFSRVRWPRRRKYWPSEAFWWTGAYDMLAERGFAFSCAIDGDILGVSPMAWGEVFDRQRPIAAVMKRDGRFNSGALFLDHVRLREIQFFEQAVDFYRTAKICEHDRCTGFCRRMGDQRLLSELAGRSGLEVCLAPNSYNHMLLWDEATYRAKNPDAPFGLDESHLLHLLAKPWLPPPRRRRLNPVTAEGYCEWWRFARQMWPDSGERDALFGRERAVGSEWRGGDDARARR